jgi:hypothetical protein
MAGIRRRLRRRSAGLRRRALEPFTQERPDALELLAMIAGSRTVKDPGVGRSTRPGMTALDVAHSLAAADDELGETMALAMACGWSHLWPRVQTLALDRFIGQLQASTRGARLIAGPCRFRARVVLRSAFDDLLLPARARPWRVCAEELRMRLDDYVWLHRQAAGLLDNRARTAAGEAKRALFGPESAPPRAPRPLRAARLKRRALPDAAPAPAPRPARIVPSIIRYGRLSLRR